METMKYTETLKKLYEVMEERQDINAVKFDRENDSLEVFTTSGIHMCFGDEFKRRCKNCVK